MKTALACLAALGVGAWAEGTWAEREPAQPTQLALFASACPGAFGTPFAGGSARRDDAAVRPLLGVDVARVQEYLYFHAQAVEGRGLASVMPWHALTGVSN